MYLCCYNCSCGSPVLFRFGVNIHNDVTMIHVGNASIFRSKVKGKGDRHFSIVDYFCTSFDVGRLAKLRMLKKKNHIYSVVCVPVCCWIYTHFTMNAQLLIKATEGLA